MIISFQVIWSKNHRDLTIPVRFFCPNFWVAFWFQKIRKWVPLPAIKNPGNQSGEVSPPSIQTLQITSKSRINDRVDNHFSWLAIAADQTKIRLKSTS